MKPEAKTDSVVDIDVVVVNFNAGNYITSLAESLHANKRFKLQIVDNASTDGSCQLLIDQDVQVIVNKNNLGFAAACNQGAAQGSARLIAFVNPDCILQAKQLEQLASFVTKTSKIALAGCQVTNTDGSTQRGTWRRLPTLWRVFLTATKLEKLPLIQGLNLKQAPKQGLGGDFGVCAVEAVNGACYVVKRSVFESINGFDEAFPLHFEDLDFFARIKDAGDSLAYIGDIKIEHVKGLSSKDNKQVSHWKKVGLLRYFKKHRPKWEAKVISMIVGLK